eukprot:jgi/Psemu1/327661/estExt_fgenesh1_pg.C_7670004
MSRFGRDGMALSQAMYRAVPRATAAANTTVHERIKAVLLEESRQPSNNSVAISFLKFGKEIGLVKYMGLAEYLRQNQGTLFSLPSLPSWNSSSSLSASSSSSSSTDHPTPDRNSSATRATTEFGSANANNGGGAKVAFMITSSMKQELIHNLGYETNIVKSMTPQQASLVLHHQVLPESYDEAIAKLEEEFREEQRKQQELVDALLEKERRENNSEKNMTTSASAADTVGNSFQNEVAAENQLMLSSKNTEELSSFAENRLTNDSATQSLTPQSSNEETTSGSAAFAAASDGRSETDCVTTDESPIHEEFEDPNLWYEVVEIRTDSEEAPGAGSTEIRHGLYRNREEAALSLETREMIQSRRETKNNNDGVARDGIASSFVLRPISEEELRIRS